MIRQLIIKDNITTLIENQLNVSLIVDHLWQSLQELERNLVDPKAFANFW